MVDGIAGIDILAALLATEPGGAAEPIAPWTARPHPSDGELLAGELGRRARGSLDLARGLGAAVRDPVAAGGALGRRTGAFVRLLGQLGSAPETPFNQPIGPHRRVDWCTFELATIKAVRARLGGTINDVVLTTVAGAVGRFLRGRKWTLDDDLRTVVPVSVRSAGDRGAPGNRVSVWLMALPLDEPDAARRLRRVMALTAECKERNEAMGAELITQAAEFTTANVVNLVTRLINAARRFNLIVTNVPGPPVPLYLLDARMTAVYPHLPLFENQGLSVALLSYAGRLSWGIGADWNQMPDLGDFVAALERSFAELCEAAGVWSSEDAALPDAATAGRPSLPVRRRGAAATPSAPAAAARGRGARTHAASAADDPPPAAPAPRRDAARSGRSTARAAGRR
jgi:WS/DGAT/MGAT family acyltransferase